MRGLSDGEQQVHDVTIVRRRDVTIATATSGLRVGGLVGMDPLQRNLRDRSEDAAEKRLFAPGCRSRLQFERGGERSVRVAG